MEVINISLLKMLDFIAYVSLSLCKSGIALYMTKFWHAGKKNNVNFDDY